MYYCIYILLYNIGVLASKKGADTGSNVHYWIFYIHVGGLASKKAITASTTDESTVVRGNVLV